MLTGLCTLASVIGLSVSSTTPAQGATAPSRPTGLTVAQESYSSVSISWDDPQDDSITGYQVLRRSRDGNDYGDGEGSWDFVVIEDDTGSADTEYTDTSVTPRTRYVYRVKARNSAGLSERSSYANAETLGVADNPTGLTVASASHDSITIEWDDPQDDGITGYQVLRRSRDGSDYGDGGGSWDFVVIEDDTGSADTEYTDTSVTPRTRYVYRVKARNPAGLSGRSSYANAETTPAPVVVVEPPVKTEQGDNKGGVHTAMQRSEADVSLSSLTVDGSSVTGVAEGETEFLVRVANATSQVTLAATATDSTSTVYYNNVDADGIAEGHQVDLRVGSNSITIRVVAQDFVTTASYTLTINRADSNVFGWAVLTDIEDVLGYGDSRGGIWSDGTYLWVSGGDYPWLYAYVLATGERQSDRDISLAAVNQDQRGIWSNGATMWVLDNEDRMLYAYNLETGARDEAKDFGVFGDEDKDYYGVWSDGETVWISTANGYTVDAYDFSSGEEKPDLKYNNLEASGQDHNAGIWSDGVRMWVVDPNRKAIFAYDSPHSERNSGWNFQRLIAAGNESPRDIWSDGVTMWVSDSADGKVYSYNMRASDNAELHSMIAAGRALADFEPDTHNYTLGVGSMVSQAAVQAIPRQILATVSYSPEDADPNSSGYQVNLNTGANSVTITVTAQDGMTSEVYTLDINRGSADPFGWKVVEDFDTLNMAGNESPAGLASDGSTMWVADEVDLKLYAYDVETKARVPDLDITLDAEQGSPGGMWTDGTTIWVFDVVDRKLYAYDVNASQRDESKDLDWPEERFPHHFGVWSDGDTLWLSQRTGGLTAYDLGTETRDEHKDYDALDGIDGIDARGIWSDGATMWVVDSTNDKIRALNVFTGEPDTGKEISTLRVADVGGTRGIWSDGETMWVTDWTAAKVYSYNLPLSDSADLRKVVVDGGEATGSTLDGAWYATVDATATQATIEWAAAQMKSTASHDGVDNGAVAEGHQLPLRI